MGSIEATHVGASTWSEYVSRHRLVGALTAGFVAVTIATVTGFWYKGLGLDNMDWPTFNGMLLLPEGSPAQQFIVGAGFHAMTGIGFTLMYCLVIHPRLPLPNSSGGNMAKAFIFAAVLTLISGLWWVPQLFGAGVFGYTFFGFNGLVGIVLWHLVYAVHLGALYNPTD